MILKQANDQDQFVCERRQFFFVFQYNIIKLKNFVNFLATSTEAPTGIHLRITLQTTRALIFFLPSIS